MQKAVRDAPITYIVATAEAQAEATREAQRAGIAHAKATEPHSYRGRKPSFDRTQLGIIRDLLAQDTSPSAIADAAGFKASRLPCAGRSREGRGDVGGVGDVTMISGPLVHGGRFDRQFFEGGLVPVRLVLRARNRDVPLTVGHHDRSVLHYVKAKRHVFLPIHVIGSVQAACAVVFQRRR